MGWSDESGFRRNNFDFLRFALACLVIFSHSFILLSGSERTEPVYRLTGGQINAGAVAVNGFFVISGFLVAGSWFNSSGVVDFLRKRILRIYPGFIVATAIAALVVVPLASGAGMSSISAFNPIRWILRALRLKEYVQTPVFTQNPYPKAVNGSLWSIPYEFYCYLMIAGLGVTGLLRNRRVVGILLALSIVGSVIFVLVQGRMQAYFPGRTFNPVRLLPYYLAGTAFYVFREKIPWSNRLACIAAVALIPAAFPQWGMTLALPVAGSYLLFWVAYHPRIRLERWARFGDFSYGIYLYAFPIQQLLILWRGPMHPLALFWVAGILAIVAGAISWHTVEKHCLRIKRRRKAGHEAGKLARLT